MDTKEKEQEYFKQLVEKYPIEERFKNTLTQIQDVLEGLEILDKVRVDTGVLGQAILNYFEDIDRLKDFEDIERVNVEKIYAYETFWFLRDKPIQIETPDMEKRYLHINEKVFAFILISKMLTEMEIGYDDVNPRMLPFLNLIYYNFKYRIFTQKSLELLIAGFFCGCSFMCKEMVANE